MKRLFVIAVALTVMLTGCSGQGTPKKGDFSFTLPEGYSVSDVTDKNCVIVSDGDGAAVGGIEITELNSRDLKDDENKNIMTYLQNEFHKTNNVEFIAFHWGKENSIVSINLSKLSDDSEEKSNFSHVFFEKDSGVYHLWLDLDVIDADLADQFLSVADPK